MASMWFTRLAKRLIVFRSSAVGFGTTDHCTTTGNHHSILRTGGIPGIASDQRHHKMVLCLMPVLSQPEIRPQMRLRGPFGHSALRNRNDLKFTAIYIYPPNFVNLFS